MYLKPIGWVWGLCLLLTLSLGMLGCPLRPPGLLDDDDADDDDSGPDPDGDEDGDGLTYQQETDAGGCLDPDNPDSDGDGWNDGEEYHGNFDPCDPADMPYVGGWGRDDCYDSFASAYVGGARSCALPFAVDMLCGVQPRLLLCQKAAVGPGLMRVAGQQPSFGHAEPRVVDRDLVGAVVE